MAAVVIGPLSPDISDVRTFSCALLALAQSARSDPQPLKPAQGQFHTPLRLPRCIKVPDTVELLLRGSH